ncbi:MAG: hypothetical protein Q4E45_05440 [Eubacteriales bacterium]|nr:hypothetical protein [Eubacteriales bacterium]
MAYGKAIELFLVNGTADSLVTAELSNWNGKAIKIPRTEVAACTRDDIKGVGVYFLICQEDDGTDSVYIGEAEKHSGSFVAAPSGLSVREREVLLEYCGCFCRA